jgi:hypothetical protein
MAYGVELRSSSNGIVFSSTDVTWSFLGAYEASANTSSSFTVHSMPERKVVAIMLDQVDPDDESFVHTHSLSGTTLTASAPSSTKTQRTLFVVLGR